MKKILLQVGLFICVLVSAYMLYSTLNAPIEFTRTVEERSDAIIERLKDIRIIQRAYKIKHGKYTDNFDELISFIENDSLEYEVAMGSEDDSVAVAQGLVSSMKVMMAAKDTLFAGRDVDFSQLPFVPTTDGVKFELDTITVKTESGIDLVIFQAAVDYDKYLGDLERQSLINLKDKRKTEDRYAGLKVGSLEKANNDAGSWE